MTTILSAVLLGAIIEIALIWSKLWDINETLKDIARELESGAE